VTGIFESGEKFIHSKEVYTLVDCLGDLGGLIEIIMKIACFIITPIAYHSYVLKTISKLFVARTKDSSLFLPPKTKLKGDSLEKQIQITALLGYYFK
jgi:hypothetical protein